MTKAELERLSDEDLIILWNNYQRSFNGKDYIYDNDAESLCSIYDEDLMRLARDVSYGAYLPSDAYFTLDDCGYICSFNFADTVNPIVIPKLLDWINGGNKND